MAKYDWKQLEREYILSEYKTVADFLKAKRISRNGSTQKNTKGWNNKKVKKEIRKSEKVIEKVIEKESEKEAQKIVKIKDVANDLMKKISESTNKIKDFKEIKQLTSALKDLNDILSFKEDDGKENKINQYLSKLEGEFIDDK